jgi:hypothetical protein
MEVLVTACTPVSLEALLSALAGRGLRGMVAMVDGVLQMPGAIVSETWRDVRLRFPVGTLTLARRGADVAVVVFGNADAPLQAAQTAVAEELGRLRPAPV